MSARGGRRPGTRGRRGPRVARALSAAGVAALAVLAGMPSGATVPVARSATLATAHPTSRAAAVPPPQAAGSARPAVTPATDVAVVVLGAMTPTVVRAGTDVTVSGTVTAPLTGPLSGPTLRVVRGEVTVDQRQALDDWAAGRTRADGPTVATTALPTVGAGQTRSFTTTIPWERLSSAKPFAAVPIAVEVVQEGAKAPTGAVRTFVAWNSRKEYVPLQVATVLPVTLDPDVDLFSRDDPTRQQAWQHAIGAGSRVNRLLSGTFGADVTLAVDPSVLGPTPPPSADGQGTPTTSSTGTGSTPTGSPAAGTSSPGSTPGSIPGSTPSGSATSGAGAPPSGTPTPGATSSPGAGTPTAPSTPTGTTAPSEAAVAIARLGDDVVRQLQGRSVWALPYADADVAATVGTDPANVLVRDLVTRATTLTGRLGEPARADVVWPVDGLLPAGRELGIRTLLSGTSVKKPAGIVVDAAAVTRATAYTPTARRVGAEGTRLLASDTRLSALLPKRGAVSPVLSVQRYLAESLVLLGERAGTPRSVLVTARRDYDPDAADLSAFLSATASAPWLRTVDAAELLTDSGDDKAVAATKPAATVPSAAPRPVLNARRLAQMAEQRDTLLSVSSVLRDGATFAATYREVLDELASARWRYERGSWMTLSSSVASDVRAATSAIKVVSRNVNLLAESGTLQVTIENGLDYAVEDLRLRLTPNNPRIQVVEQPGSIAIGPASRTNVPVPVTAVAAGSAQLRAYLTTADGTVIGSPAVIEVSANPLDATIYWVGGTLVGLVLLVGVARAVLRGTSRVDEIADIEAVTAAHQGVGDQRGGDRRDSA
ncbi:DUF6049 family protein [Terrabacter sp. NPDC000476]|uniref:DUF6049 family protein n=1 Tax=Terrabacter sp. NPDC000476 TaxID=3154258 RepID=UPI0033232B76